MYIQLERNQMRSLVLFSLWTFVIATAGARAAQPVQLASTPTVSPDGKLLAFSWARNIWVVPSKGGTARQLTNSAALDYEPEFSPSGKQIAFTSDRTGRRQVYVVDVKGGEPQQLTFHSDGCSLHDWYPDGDSLLINASRDHFWRNAQRFFKIPNKPRAGEQLLFDAYGSAGQLSPNGKKLLFTREGMSWWWKGYRRGAGEPGLALRSRKEGVPPTRQT